MVKKDIKNYILSNYFHSLDTITNLSKTDNKESYILSDHQMYNFDVITKHIFLGNKNIPSSADALTFSDNNIQFFEFKTGFKKKITKNNFDRTKMTCERINAVCDEYVDLFLKKQLKDTEQLIDCIKMKAIESYITLEKMIIPSCNDICAEHKLCFCVVIDSDDIDRMEETLSELGNVEVENNCIDDIKKALSRFNNKIDANGNSYYYDLIEVLTQYEFVLRDASL
jgi:hypothetical protein